MHFFLFLPFYEQNKACSIIDLISGQSKPAQIHHKLSHFKHFSDCFPFSFEWWEWSGDGGLMDVTRKRKAKHTIWLESAASLGGGSGPGSKGGALTRAALGGQVVLSSRGPRSRAPQWPWRRWRTSIITVSIRLMGCRCCKPQLHFLPPSAQGLGLCPGPENRPGSPGRSQTGPQYWDCRYHPVRLFGQEVSTDTNLAVGFFTVQ